MSIRYEQLSSLLNTTARSGQLNIRFILEEMVKELGLDPAKALIKSEKGVNE